MAWSPKAADSREAGYIYANRYVSKAPLRLQKRSGPYISRGEVLQHKVVQTQVRNQTLQRKRGVIEYRNSECREWLISIMKALIGSACSVLLAAHGKRLE